MIEQLTESQFGRVADRWLPLIYKGAIEYQIGGKFDVDDLVQEGLLLLYTEISKRVVDLQMWEIESMDFEKYFKSALFHRFVDLKRTQATKKRDYTKEVHATDDFDPIANLSIASGDDPNLDIASDTIYSNLVDRLSPQQVRVLDCLVHPPEALLKSIREHRCPECLWMGDPTPDGKCPACIPNGFDVPATLEPCKSPSRVLQAEIQDYLGMRRMAVSDAIYVIRQTIKSLDRPDPHAANLKPFMELFGYGDVLDGDGFATHRPWPSIASCRYEEGCPTQQRITFPVLRDLFNDDENLLLDFMVSHPNEYYTKLRFTDLAQRIGISVHRLRGAVDSIRVKLEFVESGVPLKDIPKDF